MRTEVATALLRPFVERSPEPTTKERLQPFFLRHFRDPRLGSGKHKWSGVPDEIRRVVIRWLVERALEQFFLLVKEDGARPTLALSGGFLAGIPPRGPDR